MVNVVLYKKKKSNNPEGTDRGRRFPRYATTIVTMFKFMRDLHKEVKFEEVFVWGGVT